MIIKILLILTLSVVLLCDFAFGANGNQGKQGNQTSQTSQTAIDAFDKNDYYFSLVARLKIISKLLERGINKPLDKSILSENIKAFLKSTNNLIVSLYQKNPQYYQPFFNSVCYKRIQAKIGKNEIIHEGRTLLECTNELLKYLNNNQALQNINVNLVKLVNQNIPHFESNWVDQVSNALGYGGWPITAFGPNGCQVQADNLLRQAEVKADRDSKFYNNDPLYQQKTKEIILAQLKFCKDLMLQNPQLKKYDCSIVQTFEKGENISFGKMTLVRLRDGTLAISGDSLGAGSYKLALELLIDQDKNLSKYPDLVLLVPKNPNPSGSPTLDVWMETNVAYNLNTLVNRFGQKLTYDQVDGLESIEYVELIGGDMILIVPRMNKIKNGNRILTSWTDPEQEISKQFKRDEFKEIFKRCAKGYVNIHENLGYIHNDVKTENMMLDPQGCTVIDFGLVAPTSPNDQIPMTGSGTPGYIAPEINYANIARLTSNKAMPIVSNEDAKKWDVFSYGVSMWEILTNDGSFWNCNTIDQAHSQFYDQCIKEFEGRVNKFSQEVKDPELKKIFEIVSASVSIDPAKRPTMKEVEAKLRNL